MQIDIYKYNIVYYYVLIILIYVGEHNILVIYYVATRIFLIT